MATRLERANAEHFSRTTSAPSQNADYTVMLRMRNVTVPTSAGTRHTLFQADAGVAGQSDDWCYLDHDGTAARVGIRARNNAGSNIVAATLGSTTAITTGTDRVVFFVRSGNDLFVYLGTSATAEVTDGGAITGRTAATRFTFGASCDGTNGLDASISDLAIWTAALNSTQRTNAATNGAAAETTNLWARWAADTGGYANGATVTDGSGNGRSLTAVTDTGTLANTTDPVVPSAGGTTVTPTGQSVTASLGSPTVNTSSSSNATVSPAGQSVTASLGTVTVQANTNRTVSVTGQQVTASLGTFDVQIDTTHGPDGLQATASLGTPTYSASSPANTNATPTGLSATASLGSVTLSIGTSRTTSPAGLVAAAFVGTPVLAGNVVSSGTARTFGAFGLRDKRTKVNRRRLL